MFRGRLGDQKLPAVGAQETLLAASLVVADDGDLLRTDTSVHVILALLDAIALSRVDESGKPNPSAMRAAVFSSSKFMPKVSPTLPTAT